MRSAPPATDRPRPARPPLPARFRLTGVAVVLSLTLGLAGLGGGSRWPGRPAADRVAEAGHDDAPSGGLTGSDSDTTPVQGHNQAAGNGGGAGPDSGTTDGAGATTGPQSGPSRSGPALNPVTVVSATPGGRPGDGGSEAPSLAQTSPEVTVFASADHALTHDDDRRSHVMVSDPDGLRRLTGDTPASRYTGLISGPATCHAGTAVAFSARYEDIGDDDVREWVVVADRRSGASRRIPAPAGLSGTPRHVTLAADCTVVAWDQDGDVYAFALDAGPAATPILVSGDAAGRPAGGSEPAVSEAGRCIAFASRGTGLVPGDTNGAGDVFLRRGLFTVDPADDSLIRISVAADGGQADGPSDQPSIAPGTCRVAYRSSATNLVVGDTNATSDVLLYDPAAGTTTPVTAGNGPSGQPSISGDGNYVAFSSAATDLVGRAPGSGRAAGISPTTFRLLDRHARPVYATSVVAVDGPRVRVAFPATADLAPITAGSVDVGALSDAQVIPVDNEDGRSNANPTATRPVGPPEAAADDLTDGPDLASARLPGEEPAAARQPRTDSASPGPHPTAVRFCFDAPVAAIPVDGPAGGSPVEADGTVPTDRFVLVRYNSAARAVSERAVVEPGPDPHCVRAGFAAGTDVTRFSVAVVRDGAVADATGRGCVQASRPLIDSRVVPAPGDVTGPNLRDVRTDVALNRATFVFDQLATAPPPADAARFGFLDSQGVAHPGRVVSGVVPSAGMVSVDFAADRDGLALARRFFVLAGAVSGAAGERNVEHVTTGGPVARPSLVAVRRRPDAATQFDFVYDAPVSGADATRFGLYTPDGTRFPAAAVAQPRTDTVRVTVAADDRVAATLTLGVSDAGAAMARSAAPRAIGVLTPGTVPSSATPLGAQPVAPGPARGLTDGPDLVTVSVDPAARTADFTFDENVRDVHLVVEAPGEPATQTDVFVRYLAGPRTAQISVDGLGRKVAGSSASPWISFDGRYVVFASSAVGLAAAATTGSNVFRRDLLVPEVSPEAIDFGTVTVGAFPTAPVPVAVTNRGFGTLHIDGTRLGGRDGRHFRLSDDRCSGQALPPEGGCMVSVAFRPITTGRRGASLVVTDDAPGSPRGIALFGRAALLLVGPPAQARPAGGAPGQPAVAVTPAVGPPGTVAAVTGSGFPPGTTVLVRWAAVPGLPGAATPISQVVAATIDAEGRLTRTFLLVLPDDVLGPRVVEVNTGRPEMLARAAFLVVPGTDQRYPGDRLPGTPAEVVIRR